MVDLNTPLWLHRQLASGNRLGADSFSNLTDALCDPRWRTYTEKYAAAFVDYAEKKYGDRIRAYIPACGVTDVCRQQDNAVSREPRFSICKRVEGVVYSRVVSHLHFYACQVERLTIVLKRTAGRNRQLRNHSI